MLVACEGIGPRGRHALRFGDGFMILSDFQLELLAATMKVGPNSHARIEQRFREERRTRWRNYLALAKLEPASPCAWNMLLRRRFVKSTRSFSLRRRHGAPAVPMLSRCIDDMLDFHVRRTWSDAESESRFINDLHLRAKDVKRS